MSERQPYETNETNGGTGPTGSFFRHTNQEAKALPGSEDSPPGSTIPRGGETPPTLADHVIEATAYGA